MGHCESLILYHKDLYIFVKVSQVTIFFSSFDTFNNTNTTPKGGAPAQAEYTSKKERKTPFLHHNHVGENGRLFLHLCMFK